MIELDNFSVLKGHSDEICCILVVEKPYNWIMTSSDDGNIVIWDANTLDLLQTIKHHESWVNSLSMWDEETVMSCSKDKTIKWFRISREKPHYKLIKEFKFIEGVKSVWRVTSDLLFVVVEEESFLFSYSRNEMVAKDSKLYVDSDTRAIKSKNYSNCFYVNTGDTVDLVDFSKKVVVNHFKADTATFFIDTFHNSKNEEILVTVGNSGMMIFNTTIGLKLNEGKQLFTASLESEGSDSDSSEESSSESSSSEEDDEEPKKSNLIKVITEDANILEVLETKSFVFFFSGDIRKKGNVFFIYRIDKETYEHKIILKKENFIEIQDDKTKIFPKCAREIRLVSKNQRSVKFACRFQNCNLYVFDVSGLKGIDEDRTNLDLEERAQFLKSHEFENNINVFSIKLENLRIDFLKTFF